MAVRLPQRCFLPVGPGVQLETQIQGERLGEPRQPSLGRARQAQQQLSQFRRLGQGAIGVEPQPDLGFLEFTEVAVGSLQPPISNRSAAPRAGKVQLGQAVLQLEPQGFSAFRSELASLPVFIEQGLQGLEIAVKSSPSQGWGEVIEDHGLAAALGLAALARIVHDEGIEMGQGPKRPFRETLLREAHGLARQPLQVAVLAHMHHGLAAEALPKPEVLGQVGMGGRQVGAVVGQLRVTVVAAVGLHQQGHGSEIQPSNWETLPTISHRFEAGIALRYSPDGLQALPTLNRQAAIPAQVARQG